MWTAAICLSLTRLQAPSYENTTLINTLDRLLNAMKYTEYLLILAQLAFASTASNISSEYEYVVVGSGAGGGTVA
jgi:hypothetical protein